VVGIAEECGEQIFRDERRRRTRRLGSPVDVEARRHIGEKGGHVSGQVDEDAAEIDPGGEQHGRMGSGRRKPEDLLDPPPLFVVDGIAQTTESQTDTAAVT
jgi:hypothetical protein